MELKTIKVTIKLKEDGSAKYPTFNDLKSVQDSQMDWSKYVDVYGLGWQYDKTSGHTEDTADSPRGQQFGMLIIPEAFADEAVAMFEDCVEITEADAKDFYENKAVVEQPDEIIDEKILTGIKLKQDLGQTLTAKQVDALDPIKDEKGITLNKIKDWAEFKLTKGVTIKTTLDAKKKSIG